jgi:hypothetical protein
MPCRSLARPRSTLEPAHPFSMTDGEPRLAVVPRARHERLTVSPPQLRPPASRLRWRRSGPSERRKFDYDPRRFLLPTTCVFEPSRLLAKVLTCERPLEAHLSGAISKYSLELDLRQFCILRLASYPRTGCIHDAAYLSLHVISGCAEFQRRGPTGVIPAREDLSYAGSDMRTSENAYLLRASVN